MDSFNKIISFVLGLVVVIVFFAVVTGKINFKKGLPSLSTSPTTTVAPTKTQAQTQAQAGSKVPSPTPTNYSSYKASGKTTTIPATGLPTLFIPSLLAGALGGMFLRKTGKK